MRRINLDLNDPAQRECVKATWRRAVGFIPGQANQGWVAEIEGSPCRLADFDDSSWEVCDNIGDVLSRGACWAWWRTTIEVPEAIDGVPIDGATLYFETTVDDYGEVWVNGECNLTTGAATGGTVRSGSSWGARCKPAPASPSRCWAATGHSRSRWAGCSCGTPSSGLRSSACSRVGGMQLVEVRVRVEEPAEGRPARRRAERSTRQPQATTDRGLMLRAARSERS